MKIESLEEHKKEQQKEVVCEAMVVAILRKTQDDLEDYIFTQGAMESIALIERQIMRLEERMK